MSINLNTPPDTQTNLAKRFQRLRLYRDIKRSTLATMSGVPESSIKRFEVDGEVSLRSLLRLAHALGALDQFVALFHLPQATSLEEIEAREDRLAGTQKRRGRK